MNDIVELVLGYLQGIWRNRWYAMVCAWLICVLGWTVVCILPDQYEASAQVIVDTQTILQPLLKGLTVGIDPDTQVALVTKTLLSRPNLEQIASLADLNIRAKGQGPEAVTRFFDELRKRIDLVSAGKNQENLFTITYTGLEPQSAQRVVQSALAVFEKNLVGGSQLDAESAQRFVDEQVSEYEKRLSEAENRLKEFKLKNVGRMPSEGQTYNARLQQEATDLSAVRLELIQAENRRNSLQQQINEALQQQIKGDGEVVALPIDQRIQTLEQNLDELLIKFTDRHPDVSILRLTIADLKKQREQERLRYAASLAESGANARNQGVNTVYQQLKVKLAEEEANIASLRVRFDEYTKRYKELQAQVNTLPRIEAELAALNRDYEVNRQQYEQLLARRESARLSQEAEKSRQKVRFRIVDPPRVPIKPTGPRRLLLMTLVLGAGLGTGVGLAFLLSQLWPTFDSRRSLMENTGIPVLGSVGMMLSPPALRRERRLTVAYVSFGGMLLVVYASLIVVERVGLL